MNDEPKKPKKIDIEEPPIQQSETRQASMSLPVYLELQEIRSRYLQEFEEISTKQRMQLIRSVQKKRNSKIIVFYSYDFINPKIAEMFFELLQEIGRVEVLDLFLFSHGGFAEPAFNISRWCRHYSDKFNVIIPSYAKSAATLLCLGADTLLMGPASEIGPIDPQMRIPDEYGRNQQVSALSIKEALKVIEGLTQGDHSKAMKYMPLIEKIDLKILGQYDREIQSAKQRAQHLLKTGSLLQDKNRNASDKEQKMNSEQVAHQLTEGYYSHGYVIDMNEAKENLGFNVLRPGDVGFDNEIWKSVWRLHKMYEDMVKNNQNIMCVFESDMFTLPINKGMPN